VTELCFLEAVELARLLRAREVSACEVLDAHLERIERVNPKVNAIVTLVPERARAAAEAADAALARGERPGVLHGLPVAHKDLALTAGIRTTMGSTIFADWVPDESSLVVERLQRAGAITIGKTNTPEFGAGSQTFNRVFGPTRNPYDLARTCGGSSGGAAAALACGLIPIADGSDMGGSLRNPASFCNVVGLRPTPGRVPGVGDPNPWSPLGVDGPMARTAADVALVLQAIAGPDPRDPLSLAEPGAAFAAPLERDWHGVRVAWSPDAGGLPTDRRVRDALAGVPATLERLGCTVIDGFPDLSDAGEIFQVLRAFAFEVRLGPLYDEHRDELKDTIRWNVEQARALSMTQLAEATRRHAALMERVRTFMGGTGFLALPTVQLPPFPVEVEWVREIEGVRFDTYLDWMRSCSDITLTGCPAASVPAAFTPDGLPVGLQLVGRAGDDFGVLQLAHAFEQETGTGMRRPALS
jgi:amidase